MRPALFDSRRNAEAAARGRRAGGLCCNPALGEAPESAGAGSRAERAGCARRPWPRPWSRRTSASVRAPGRARKAKLRWTWKAKFGSKTKASAES